MTQELLVNNLGEITRAEIDIQIATAKKYPRDVSRSIHNAKMLATLDEKTSQSCFYVIPRTDKDGNKKEIIGPSIRLAEIFASSWGNMHCGARILSNDGKYITAEGVAFDHENNMRFLMPVQLAIHGKNKKGEIYTYNESMQQTITASAAAKAIRNAIFKVIPLALVTPVMELAMKNAIGDQKTLSSKRNEVFEKLVKMGIDRQKILDYYGKEMNDFTQEDVRALMGVGVAIKEGIVKIDDVFSTEVDRTETKPLSASERVNLAIENNKKSDEDKASTDEFLRQYDSHDTSTKQNQ